MRAYKRQKSSEASGTAAAVAAATTTTARTLAYERKLCPARRNLKIQYHPHLIRKLVSRLYFEFTCALIAVSAKTSMTRQTRQTDTRPGEEEKGGIQKVKRSRQETTEIR